MKVVCRWYMVVLGTNIEKKYAGTILVFNFTGIFQNYNCESNLGGGGGYTITILL